MEADNVELLAMILVPTFIFILISVTSLIAFKYWGPGGVIEKEQEKKESH